MMKIKASTLIEMILVMILMGIITSMAYSALGIFTKNFEFFKKVTSRNYDITLLEKLLHKDFREASFVKTDNPTQFQFLYDSKPSVNYTFTENKIIRNALSIDTFHIKTKDLKSIQLENSHSIIKGLEFTYYIDNQEISLSFEKDYPADIFINQDKTE